MVGPGRMVDQLAQVPVFPKASGFDGGLVVQVQVHVPQDATWQHLQHTHVIPGALKKTAFVTSQRLFLPVLHQDLP